MIEVVLQIVALALVVWCVSTSVAKAKMFEPLRNWINPWFYDDGEAAFHLTKGDRFRLWVWELVSCQRCLAHWVAIPVLLLFPTRVLQCGVPLVEFVANWFLVVAVNDVVARKLQKREMLVSSYRRKNP